jgi:hypothetical protein
MKEKIGEGYLENELYFLSTIKSCFNVLHKRVRHSSDKILKFMFDILKYYCSNCEVVSLVKYIKLFL